MGEANPRRGLRRCLGEAAVTAQAVGTVGLTLTAVINIPQVQAGAGHSTALCYLAAFGVMVLVCESLVLFQGAKADAAGIAGYVRTSLGRPAGLLAAWMLTLGYAATLVACLAFLGWYLNQLVAPLGVSAPPALAVVLGGSVVVVLARRDVRLSTRTMMVTEAVSVLIVLGLCGLVLWRGAGAQDWQALNPRADSLPQVQAGLMAAVLSFIGFESAATLGAESLLPQQAVPRALRRTVLVAGGLFVVWAVVLSEGLSWLPAAERSAMDPISLLADRLGQAGAADWIRFGAVLCLLGTCIGCLSAVGRILYALAEEQVLPAVLTAVHPRFGTPALALGCAGIPALVLTTVAVQQGISSSTLFNQFGSFSVLGFLLVYGLVSLGCLARPLPGDDPRRRLWIGGLGLSAVSALLVAFIGGLLPAQTEVVAWFSALVILGGALIWRAIRGQDQTDQV